MRSRSGCGSLTVLGCGTATCQARSHSSLPRSSMQTRTISMPPASTQLVEEDGSNDNTTRHDFLPGRFNVEVNQTV